MKAAEFTNMVRGAAIVDARGVLQRAGAPVMVGAVQNPNQEPSPRGNPPSGGTRRLVMSEILVHNLLGNGSTDFYNNDPATFAVKNPSGRLALIIGWTYEPDSTEDTDFPGTNGNWLVSADAWIYGGNGQTRLMRGNNIFTSRAIPTTYEVVTMVPEIRGTVLVPEQSEGPGAGTGVPPGRLYLTAHWEPAPGDDISDEELRKIFDACNIRVNGKTAFQNGAG